MENRMLTKLTTLVSEADSLLHPELFADYCPNGLQVEGNPWVAKLVAGVTASQDLIDYAVRIGADALLVHHGYFWRGENPCVVGMKQRRIAKLLRNDISLLAYHLPLDCHPELGNNAQLGKLLGFKAQGELEPDKIDVPGQVGVLPQPMSGEDLTQLISERLDRAPLHIPGKARKIRQIAWCSGAAADYIEYAVQLGMDAFLTGEASEPTVHIARENGLHFYAAGHHATERYGSKAVGIYLARKLGIAYSFIDIDNPV